MHVTYLKYQDSQTCRTVAEDIFIWSVGPKCSVNQSVVNRALEILSLTCLLKIHNYFMMHLTNACLSVYNFCSHCWVRNCKNLKALSWSYESRWTNWRGNITRPEQRLTTTNRGVCARLCVVSLGLNGYWSTRHISSCKYRRSVFLHNEGRRYQRVKCYLYSQVIPAAHMIALTVKFLYYSILSKIAYLLKPKLWLHPWTNEVLRRVFDKLLFVPPPFKKVQVWTVLWTN